MSTARANPYLTFFPYLPLERSYSFGPWKIGPLKSYQGPWLNADFEQMSKRFMASFRDADGKQLADVCLLSHRTRGMEGRLPNAPQRIAIQRAVDFAVLDRALPIGDPNAGLRTATADNTELLIWPIDTINGYVTLSRGSMVRQEALGHKIGAKLQVPAPLELHMPWSFTLDGELLAAMYHLFTRRLNGADDKLRRRILTAVGWHAKAWRNSPSIGMGDRVVYLKTGFEALSDESNTRLCARWLRDLYEAHLGTNPSKYMQHILWSSAEKPWYGFSYTVKGKNVNDVATHLEHWVFGFGKVRNSIIHDGAIPKLTYRTRGSRYNGHFVNVAERLLRESIKVSMIKLGYPDLWRGSLWRAIDKAYKKASKGLGGS